MEAPEKLYVNINILGDVSAYKEDWCHPPYCVEYIRKDAFIEKACKWLKKNRKNYSLSALGEEYLIDDFKKAMKGE